MTTRIMPVALVVVSTFVVAILIAGIAYAGDPAHGNGHTSGGAPPVKSVIRQRVLWTPSRALEMPGQTKPGGQRFRMDADSFFSSFEPPCTLGYIGGGGSGVPQNCEWHASNGVIDAPPPTHPVIDHSNPFAGEQHLHLEFDPFQPSGPAARNWAFSDNIANPPVDGVMTLDLMLYINEPGGLNEYRVRPQAPSQRMATAEMLFLPSGEIVCCEDLDPNDGEFDCFVTGFTWVQRINKIDVTKKGINRLYLVIIFLLCDDCGDFLVECLVNLFRRIPLWYDFFCFVFWGLCGSLDVRHFKPCPTWASSITH